MRRPPGPAEAITLGIDPQTLRVLQAAQRDYGNVVAFKRPNGRLACFVNEPTEIRKILVRKHGNYLKGPGFERVKMLLGNGLIVSDGETWRRSRTMIQPAFSRANVHRLIPLMMKSCRACVLRWTDAADARETLNITQETSDFALELILRAIFGPDYDRCIISGGDNPFAFLSQDSTRDLRVVLKLRELRELVLRIIADRRAGTAEETSDFLATYLTARDKAGNAFTDEELLDELMTLIVAGYETSAGTLNWAWYLLAQHAEMHASIADEAARVMPDTAGDIEIANMRYTQAFLEETLRLYPPVWLFTRRAREDDSLTDFDLPAGTDIYLSPYILHRTAEFWPEPARANPQRFDPDADGRKAEWPYFPFSLGPRRCLGEYFSFLEMKIHLGLLTREFDMALAQTEMPRLDLGINLRSQSDIFLRPSLRQRA